MKHGSQKENSPDLLPQLPTQVSGEGMFSGFSHHQMPIVADFGVLCAATHYPRIHANMLTNTNNLCIASAEMLSIRPLIILLQKYPPTQIQPLLCSVQFACMLLLVVQHTGMPFLVRATNKAHLKVCVPAIAYAVQNNLYYIALGNIDATTYTTDVLEDKENTEAGSRWIGVIATVGMCWTSAFAGMSSSY
ncbi:hypothetical protein ANCDUO_04433 [Ancylostoma duodenale]|uniref:Uncharacterized protein n=1 Tax=Ancylostoma duodenale TaxID=51022 RepID=A0A0C2H0Z0_9BILA|nr:hypothetical protein ANCDUO_04433 [Ancylostoma duodenale]